MAPHSSTLAWKIPWAEDPGRLQSMGLLRVGHDGATSRDLHAVNIAINSQEIQNLLLILSLFAPDVNSVRMICLKQVIQ